MVGDRGIEGFYDIVVQRCQTCTHLGEFKRFSVGDGRVRIYDGMKALALGESRVDGGSQTAQLHRKPNVVIADEYTRHKLTRCSQAASFADRMLKMALLTLRMAQHFRHEEATQRFTLLRRLDCIQVPQANALHEVEAKRVMKDSEAF